MLVSRHQLGQAELHCLRPLGRVSGDQHWLTERWRLLLDPAGISHHKVTPLQQKDKLGIIDRLDQQNVLMPTKRLDGSPHIGVSMRRKNNPNIRSQGDARQRATNPLEPAVETFSAMTSHQDQTFPLEMR